MSNLDEKEPVITPQHPARVVIKIAGQPVFSFENPLKKCPGSGQPANIEPDSNAAFCQEYRKSCPLVFDASDPDGSIAKARMENEKALAESRRAEEPVGLVRLNRLTGSGSQPGVSGGYWRVRSGKGKIIR